MAKKISEVNVKYPGPVYHQESGILFSYLWDKLRIEDLVNLFLLRSAAGCLSYVQRFSRFLVQGQDGGVFILLYAEQCLKYEFARLSRRLGFLRF